MNRWLFNADTIDKVIENLMTKGIRVAGGDRLGKTIIFAANQRHADFIAQRFDVQYPHLKGAFARIITHRTEHADSLIDEFSIPDQDPHIAISVDMLDTGIDVPEVVNLVFFKPVRSKIKFWQMLGRGTRLCDDLFGPGEDKTEFLVFDHCGNFEFFGQDPDTTVGSTAESLGTRLFKRRLDLIAALQDDGSHPELRNGLADILWEGVAAINLDNVVVRPHQQVTERFQSKDSWTMLSLEDLHALASELVANDYLQVPIGDPITTELVVGFTRKIRQFLHEADKFRPEQLARIIERIQRIEDVRPTMAAFRWVFYETERLTQGGATTDQLELSEPQQLLLRDIMGTALRELSTDFGEMQFYQAWRDLHNHLGCDVPEQIELALLALRHTGPRTVARVLGIWDSLAALVRPVDSLAQGAARELGLPTAYPGGMRFVVYGHTHEPLAHALPRRRKSGGDLRYADLYLNAGTWRDRVFAAADGLDFARWRSATYIVLYSEDENQPSGDLRRIGPAFDSWTGHRAND